MPALFDSQGRFLQSVGRRGRGPGEFVQPVDLLVLGKDSTVVIDASGRRAIVFDASVRPVRHIGLGFQMYGGTVVSWPSVVIANGSQPTTAQAGWPMHVVSFAGKDAVITKSFGPGDGELRPERVLGLRYSLTMLRGGSFWSGWTYGYDVFQWSPEGVLLRSLERRPSWFREPSPSRLGTPTEPPPPFIAGVEQDDEGLLWVFARVAGPSWKDAWPTVPKGTTEVDSRRIAIDRLFGTTMLEVLDPRTGRVIARKTIDGYVVGALQNRRGAFFTADDQGEGKVLVMTFELRGR